MIIETPQWKLAIEVRPADWRFPAGITWLAGWIWSPEKRVLTDLAYIEIADGAFHLKERAPGVSVDEIRAKTAGRLIVPASVPEMKF